MRIALVEDEKKLAETLKKGLVSEGYLVDIFLHGEQAESRLRETPDLYDLFIFDLMLPGRSGLEICQSLRQAGITTATLILTARNNLEDKVTLLDAGADDFMTKPFAFDELLARLRALARRPHQVLPTALVIGDLQLSPNSREALRAGKKLILTAKEFNLLHYLMRNQGRVVHRSELLDHVWAQDNSMSNVLDVHIKNLREKIDAAYERKFIQTVRGVGYTIPNEAA